MLRHCNASLRQPAASSHSRVTYFFAVFGGGFGLGAPHLSRSNEAEKVAWMRKDAETNHAYEMVSLEHDDAGAHVVASTTRKDGVDIDDVDALTFSREALFTLAVVGTTLVGGTVYGWPALRRDLIREDGGGISEKQLGAVFTAGSWSANGGRFVIGLCRDAWGSRRTACACLAAVMLGGILIATSTNDDVPRLAFGMFCLGLGSGVQMCLQPVCGLFPSRLSTAMATLSGAFQISGLVFTVLSAAGDRRLAYLGHAAVAGILLVSSAVMLPWGKEYVLRTTATPPERANEPLGNKIDVAEAAATMGDAMTNIVRENDCEIQKRMSRRDQMMSTEYLLLITWFSILMAPLQYYITSIGTQRQAPPYLCTLRTTTLRLHLCLD